jgi:hypothetical protein
MDCVKAEGTGDVLTAGVEPDSKMAEERMATEDSFMSPG